MPITYKACNTSCPAAANVATPAPAHQAQQATPSGPLPEAAAPSAIPEQAPAGQSSLFTADVAPAKLKPGVYARGRHTQDVATAQLGKVTGGTRCSANVLCVTFETV